MAINDTVLTQAQPIGFRVWEYGAPHGRGVRTMARAHSHPDVEVNFLMRGLMRYAFGGRFVSVTPGRLSVFWGSIPHQSIEVAPDSFGVWVTYPLPLLLSWKIPHKFEERLLRGEFVQSRAGSDDEERDRLLLSRWPADYQRVDPESRRILLLEIEARMRRLAADTLADRNVASRTPAAAPEPGLESALAFLHGHYRDDIHAADVAAAAGWDPKYLMRKFKAALNISVGDYLAQLRIAHAQFLLIATDKSMIEIAFESGYQSVAPFYQAFRQAGDGATPLQFRKRAQAARGA